MSLQAYLDLPLGVAKKKAQSTGILTTRNAEESWIPLNVDVWDNIMSDLPQFSDQIAKRNADTDDDRVTLQHRKRVTAEAGITTHVEVVSRFVATSCGGNRATMSAQGVRGSPDIRLFESTSGQTMIVGEVKTFWAFPVTDGN
jgi:hypothetical protein